MSYESLNSNQARIEEIIEDIVPRIIALYNNEACNIHKNVVDPFSATIEGLILNLSQEEWITKELSRQTQKTFQNIVGEFHQKVLSTFDGWRDLGTGNVLDIKNEDLKIVAEIKNKYNTTKGNHRISVYDDIESIINRHGDGYKGYLVEVIPQRAKRYDKEFTPSHEGTRRPSNPNIRIIDGYSFYDKVSGHENTLEDVFKLTFETIKRIRSSSIEYDEYKLFFNKAYKKAE